MVKYKWRINSIFWEIVNMQVSIQNYIVNNGKNESIYFKNYIVN